MRTRQINTIFMIALIACFITCSLTLNLRAAKSSNDVDEMELNFAEESERGSFAEESEEENEGSFLEESAEEEEETAAEEEEETAAEEEEETAAEEEEEEEEGSFLEESEEEESTAKVGEEDKNSLFVELEDGTTFTYCKRNYERRHGSCRRCKKGWISNGSGHCVNPKDPKYKIPKAKPCPYGYHRWMGNCKRIKKDPKPQRNKNLKCKSGFYKFQGKCYPRKLTLKLPKHDKNKKCPKHYIKKPNGGCKFDKNWKKKEAAANKKKNKNKNKKKYKTIDDNRRAHGVCWANEVKKGRVCVCKKGKKIARNGKCQ